MSDIESIDLAYWEARKADYEEGLEQELSMEIPDDTLIELLREHIEECVREINVRD